MFYAYHSEGDFDFSSLAGYPQCEVAAWSMGVWYASRLKALQDVQPTRTVALCGTPWPIDDRYGIPRAVFDATLAGLSPRSVEKFVVRMEGGVAAYRQSPFRSREAAALKMCAASWNGGIGSVSRKGRRPSFLVGKRLW